MVKIEEVLMADKKVIKKHSATLEKGTVGMPVGDLCLTDTRLIFIPKKR